MLNRASAGAAAANPRSELGSRLRDRALAVGAVPPHPWIWAILASLVAAALTVSRRPDALFHAQFWAEDGSRWYANAYEWGWLHATITPAGGYFQTLSRLTAAASLSVNLQYAPLLYNMIALTVQVLPVVLLVSPRLSNVIPDFRIRILVALLYVGLPNSFELHLNITNAMTHLALLAALIIFARPPRHPVCRAIDIFLLALSGLTGVFVVALAPVALARWLTDRDSRWRLAVFALVATGAIVQLTAVFGSGLSDRPHPELGASIHGFMAIVAGNVFAGSVIGLSHYSQLFAQSWWEPHSLALKLTFVFGIAVVAYAGLRGTFEVRALIGVAGILLTASLLTPLLSLTGQQWPQLAHPGAGDRYYFFPMIAFLVSLVWIGTRSRVPPAAIGAWLVIAANLVIGVPGDWSYPPYTDFHPEASARVFNAAPPGTRVVIPINPPGWTIQLTKK